MDVKIFDKIYEENKKLDKIFYELYGNSDEIILKNKLELLVELGELANETKCFKYWSNKLPDRDMMLEEYADCMLMVFYMFNDLEVSLDEEFLEHKENDIVRQFMYLFEVTSRIDKEYNKEVVKEIFVNLVYLGHLLGFSDEEIVSGCMRKIEINIKRIT